jgi:hypothetical protein
MAQESKLLELILQQLESLNDKTDKLGAQLNENAEEFAKFSGIKHTVGDIKIWKEEIEKVVSIEELRELKETVTDYKKFKTKIVTIISAVGFIITCIIAFLTRK